MDEVCQDFAYERKYAEFWRNERDVWWELDEAGDGGARDQVSEGIGHERTGWWGGRNTAVNGIIQFKVAGSKASSSFRTVKKQASPRKSKERVDTQNSTFDSINRIHKCW